MRLKFNRGAVLLGLSIGLIVTVATIALASLFTDPEQLIFIYPASLLWIVILAVIARHLKPEE